LLIKLEKDEEQGDEISAMRKKEACFRAAIFMFAYRGVHPFGIFTYFANNV